MFYKNQAPSPSTAKGLNLGPIFQSKPTTLRFHLWICLATRWVGMFFGDMEGEYQYICNTWMDEVSERAKTIQNTRSAVNVWSFFCIKLTKKKWYFETHRYFFCVFSECTNYLVTVPHWWTIPYDLGMVRLDAKSSKSQGWSIFPSLPASKVSLAAAGAQRCAPMNWRRVDGC